MVTKKDLIEKICAVAWAQLDNMQPIDRAVPAAAASINDTLHALAALLEAVIQIP